MKRVMVSIQPVLAAVLLLVGCASKDHSADDPVAFHHDSADDTGDGWMFALNGSTYEPYKGGWSSPTPLPRGNHRIDLYRGGELIDSVCVSNNTEVDAEFSISSRRLKVRIPTWTTFMGPRTSVTINGVGVSIESC